MKIFMKNLFYIFFQCTWGFIQTIIGFFIFLAYKKCRHYSYQGTIITEWKQEAGLSMGLFIFLPENLSEDNSNTEQYVRLRSHEYGHTIQSLILGPLYLLVIALPSALWYHLPVCKKYRHDKQISYYQFYTEKWADHYIKKAK